MRILSIETSCDETAAAITEWNGTWASVLVNTVSSQASLHAKWGGVVPDLASREHIRNIVPVIGETLGRADMKPDDIDLIAVTQGPGLMPALVIGVSAAKALALVWKKPLMGINHLEGHIYANFANSQISNSQFLISKQIPKSKIQNQKSENIFPLVALIVSGGHTQLMLMRDHFEYELLGETQDDAAGEAFDKVAKMLGLSYPGGPAVSRKADAFRERNFQFPISNFQTNPSAQISKTKQLFPRPMIESNNFDFSFSGLKTSVLYFLKKSGWEMPAQGGSASGGKDETFIDMVCHEFQEAVVDVLVGKTRKALELYAPRTFVIAGGVSANERLRNRLRNMIEERFPDTAFRTPEFTYSLDNAAMIGVAAAYRYERLSDEEKSALTQTHLTLNPDANLPLV